MSNRIKTHKKWAAQLKVYLSKITWCEKCGVSGYLDIAHRLKRRFIGYRESDRAEYFMAAKLCRKCHQSYDEATGFNVHAVMWTDITKLVLFRESDNIVGEILVHPLIEWPPELIYKSQKFTNESQ